MPYGLKYFAEYKREDAGTTRLEIEERDYTLYTTEVKCTSLQWVQGNGNASIQDVIKGTKLNIGLATITGQEQGGFDYDLDFAFEDVQSEVGFEEFYTQEETKFRVTMYRETDVIYFRGFILPDIFLDDYIDTVRIVQFTASDRLNRLVDVDINQFGPFASNRSIARLVLGARDNLLLDDMGVIGSTRLKESTGNPAIPTTTEISVNRNYLFEPDRETGTESARNFDTVLRNLGKTFFSQIFQWKGNIYFYSIANTFYNQANIAKYEADPSTPVLETIDTSLTNISGKMLARPSIEGQPTARRARVIHKIGNQLFDGFKRLVLWGQFEMNAWQSMAYSGGFRWRLIYWKYINCNYTNQASRGFSGLPSENFVLMHRQNANIALLEAIESTNEGQIVTPQMLLRFSLKYYGTKTKYSANGFEDRGAFFVFQLIIRNESETWYLIRNDAGAFFWSETVSYIRIRFTAENFQVWNDFVVDNLTPPISGSVHVRLLQTLQTGSTSRFRFHSAYDEVEVSSRANEELEDRDVTYLYDGDGQGYSSFVDDMDTELGDFNNSFSESALMIGDNPTQFWAFNNQGTQFILRHTARLYGVNTTRPRLTINCRVIFSDLDITRGVIVDGIKYRINSASLDDAKNTWTLELQQVYS
jgi:hypothetical protein